MVKRRVSRPETKLNISPKNFGALSEHRREELQSQMDNGIIKEANSKEGSSILNPPPDKATMGTEIRRGTWIPKTGVEYKEGSTKIATVAHSHGFSEIDRNTILAKYANFYGGNAVGSVGSESTAGSSFERFMPEIYSPLYTMANLNLPRDRITTNSWCRNYFKLHPVVRNAITLHATYPISKLNLKCSDRKVLQFFEDMIEEMDLMTTLGEVAQEYWCLGEVFPYAELDERTKKWNRIIVQNPDYIVVQKTVLSGEPSILLRPDSVLTRLITSNNPADVKLRRQIPEKVLYHIRRGENIPLDNFNVSHLKMTTSPYDIRGTSIIVGVFKDLLLFDKIRESKIAQADGMINPITVIKVGGQEGEYRATDEDLEAIRHIFEEAQYDKDAKIITHSGIQVERHGFSGTVMDVSSDLDFITKNIYTGLMVPPAIVESEGAAYASASIGLEVLRQRYFNFRNIIAKWLVNKIFAPISEIQDFYRYEAKEKHLIVPEVEWNHMNLYDLQDYIGNISGMVSSGQASVQTLYKSLGLNYEEEKVKMRQESIDKAIRMKEESALASMSLTELRALDAEKPIEDPIDSGPKDSGGEEELAPPMGGEIGGEIGGSGQPEVEGGTPDLGPGIV